MIRTFPLVLLLALTACSRNNQSAASAETAASGLPAPPTQSAQAGGQAVSPGQEAAIAQPVPAVLPAVLARVNGEAIEKAEFERAIRELEGRAGEPVPADQRDQVYRSILDQLIAYRLLVQETRTRRILITEAELNGRVAEIRQQFPSEEAFRQTLEQRNMTVAALRDDARAGMQIDKMLEAEIGSKIAATPAQIEEFYKANPTQFQQGDRVRARHILIPFPENADAAAKEQARTWAAEILKAVKAGNDFAMIAKEQSQDPGSAANGGDLGFFERGQMVGPFDEAAFSLQPGQISDLVETTFGYHIIRVEEKQPPRTIPLAEIRPQIQQFLEEQHREEQTQLFIEALRAKSNVQLFI